MNAPSPTLSPGRHLRRAPRLSHTWSAAPRSSAPAPWLAHRRHLANAGIPVLMLDISPQQGAVEPARAALETLSKAKPAAFYEPANARLITAGTFDRDLAGIAQCDWVIEAVAENLELKPRCLRACCPTWLRTQCSRPTPRIAIGNRCCCRRGEATILRNPFLQSARYMKLLEVIPTNSPTRRWWPRSQPSPIACSASR